MLNNYFFICPTKYFSLKYYSRTAEYLDNENIFSCKKAEPHLTSYAG